ncbi:hypothetical protein Pelo_17262 [Pelomyxa schiedti]|nr:hypothetical protein Pelo_17262 [Pelomyxa schiedti]
MISKSQSAVGLSLVLAFLSCTAGGFLSSMLLAKVPAILSDNYQCLVYTIIWALFYLCPEDLFYKFFSKMYLWLPTGAVHYTYRALGIISTINAMKVMLGGAFAGSVIMGTLGGCATSLVLNIARVLRGDRDASLKQYFHSPTVLVPFISSIFYCIVSPHSGLGLFPLSLADDIVLIFSLVTGIMCDLDEHFNTHKHKE